MEKGSEVFYWYYIPANFTGVCSWVTLVLVRRHGFPSDSAIFGILKRGTQSFGSSSRRQGLKAKEYLGLRYWKVRRVTLSTDRGLVGLSAVQVEV